MSDLPENLLRRRRNSLRLEQADYSQPGAYFIKITSNRRQPIFGRVVGGQMICSRFGTVVWDVWRSLPDRYTDISIDAAIVIPDHFHGIIIVHDPVGAIHESPLPRRRMKLPLAVEYLKMITARDINRLRGTPGQAVWQRGYYDHILRGDKDYDALSEYIAMNPQNWQLDKE